MKKRQAKGFIDTLKIKKVYRASFPVCERKPFSIIKKMQKKGKSDIWIYEEEGKFLGFASTINGENAVLVDYLAVSPKERGRGLGGMMLQDLRGEYTDGKLFLEIEAPMQGAANNEERKKRKKFYLRNGMQEVGLTVNIFKTDMELLSYGLHLTFEEYREFYRQNYSEFAANHISPAKGILPDPNTKRKRL